jgi:hypothetical protein
MKANQRLIKQFPVWIETNSYYNTDIVKCKVYGKTFRGSKGNVYVIDESNFMFTCSFGASSEYSFTGCFYKLPVFDVQSAMNILDVFVPLYLADKRPKIEEIINNILTDVTKKLRS